MSYHSDISDERLISAEMMWEFTDSVERERVREPKSRKYCNVLKLYRV